MAVSANGVVYGTTYEAGTGCAILDGCGAAFHLTPPSAPGGAWNAATIYEFTSPVANCTLLLDASGVVYGTGAELGYKYGASFELSPPSSSGGTWTENVIAKFGTFGPYGQIMGPSGEIYGLTREGGKGYGVVYELTPPATPGGSWSQQTIHQFSSRSSQGVVGVSLVLGPGGVLYGSASAGGVGCTGTGCGTLFKLTPPAAPGGHWTYTPMYNFKGGADSAYPTGLAIDDNGVLYGTTLGVDTGQPKGTVFQYVP